jgi:hypothetical protein
VFGGSVIFGGEVGHSREVSCTRYKRYKLTDGKAILYLYLYFTRATSQIRMIPRILKLIKSQGLSVKLSPLLLLLNRMLLRNPADPSKQLQLAAESGKASRSRHRKTSIGLGS